MQVDGKLFMLQPHYPHYHVKTTTDPKTDLIVVARRIIAIPVRR
jgi:hypothetical protein